MVVGAYDGAGTAGPGLMVGFGAGTKIGGVVGVFSCSFSFSVTGWVSLSLCLGTGKTKKESS